MTIKMGILGGTGVYDIDGIDGLETVTLDTPFGAPSDAYMRGTLDGCELYFLPRHGRGHRLLPAEINHRANIYGFKQLGVDRVLSISAVGSLKEAYRPRDIVLVDQYYDRTKASDRHTFFGNGVAAHVTFADPTSAALRAIVHAAARDVIDAQAGEAGEAKVHVGGTYVNMEGPAFSTRAESNAYRQFGFDVIGMTSLAEAKLCREAEISYQPLAMITDYDCWHPEAGDVSVEMVVAHLQANATLGKAVVREAALRMPETLDCPAQNALATALLTAPDSIPPEARERLAAILGRYL